LLKEILDLRIYRFVHKSTSRSKSSQVENPLTRKLSRVMVVFRVPPKESLVAVVEEAVDGDEALL
jgi:hypothetical protein